MGTKQAATPRLMACQCISVSVAPGGSTLWHDQPIDLYILTTSSISIDTPFVSIIHLKHVHVYEMLGLSRYKRELLLTIPYITYIICEVCWFNAIASLSVASQCVAPLDHHRRYEGSVRPWFDIGLTQRFPKLGIEWG